MSLNFGMRCSTVLPNKPTLTEKNLPDQHGKVRLPIRPTKDVLGVPKQLVLIIWILGIHRNWCLWRTG